MNNQSDSLDKIMAELSVKVNTHAVNITNVATQVQIQRDNQTNAQTKKVGPIVILDADIAKVAADGLMSSMSAGAKEFEAKAGRPMTYAEMRSMWG